MNKEEKLRKIDELPPRRKKVLLKFLTDKSSEQIMMDLDISDNALNRHFTELYRNFGILGDRYERKRLELYQLLVSCLPDLISESNDSHPDGDVTLKENSIYIERPPIEKSCYKEIEQPGALLRIKAPQGFGKTSLLTKILNKAESNGYKKVRLTLLDVDEASLNDLDPFLRWFCNRVCRGLRLSAQPPEKFGQSEGMVAECKNYFEDHVLSQIDCPLVLGLDVVDRIFPYPIAKEFLTMFRSWHEAAKDDKNWEKFRLVMAYSTEVYVPIDVYQSPFNVGQAVELPEFDKKQVHDLAQRHGVNSNVGNEVKLLMDLVGGHPTLLYLPLSYIHLKNITIQEVLENATKPGGIYHNHLQAIWEELKKHSELIAAIKNVVDTSEAIEIKPNELLFQLQSLGLVKSTDNNRVIPRCELYRQYLHERLQGEE
ncbi:MAG: AAA-like domain-containing protein [Calothrix sp. MO_167.B42]|nr:AAA-like domain-containing protein [Calothrix sp. MO_167.B42]